MPRRRHKSDPSGWGVFSGTFAGVDQGTDWSSAGAIPALGRGRITDVSSAPIVEGGTWPVVVYELDEPPPSAPSKYVYIAENFTPTVKVGDRVKPGQTVGRAKGSYPYIEVGFNQTPRGWTAFGGLGGPQQAGYAMRDYIDATVRGGAPPPPGPAGPTGPAHVGSRPRPGTGSGGGGGILGFFDSAGSDIGSAAGWVASAGGGDPTGGISAVWSALTGSVGGAVDFLRAALWLVNPLNWLRAAEALAGFVLIVLGVLIAVKADELARQIPAGSAVAAAAAE